MRLTKGDYCRFNLTSRTQLLIDKGVFVTLKKINEVNEIKIFQLDDFFVEVLSQENKVVRADPVLTRQLLEFYCNQNDPASLCLIKK